VALPHVLHCDGLSLPASDRPQLALVPVSDAIRATHLGGRGEKWMPWMPPPWKCSRPGWMGLWVTWS